MARRSALVWFRRDLRVVDNPAIDAALRSEADITGIVVLDPFFIERCGPHRYDRYMQAVDGLAQSFERMGWPFLRVTGDPRAAIPELAASFQAVYANADVSPFARKRDRSVASRLDGLAVPFNTYWGNLVHHPGAVLTAAGRTSAVFAPFYRRWVETPRYPWPSASEHPDLQAGPAERAAIDRVHEAIGRLGSYSQARDVPSVAGTTELSCDLHFGTVSPRFVFDTFTEQATQPAMEHGATAVIRQLAWRDWYAHHMWQQPAMARRALNPAFDLVEWRDDPDGFEAWKAGLTGYPLVDAGMRQLAQTGWMHNRVRMVAASFLVKDLLIDWRRGAAWFDRMLIDAEPSQNIGNWQWAAGVGLDAAPYFRVFNPVAQSQKFDGEGTYIRAWAPELRSLTSRDIHAPWLASPQRLADSGVRLGDDYPLPIVDHAAARERALGAYGLAKQRFAEAND